MALNFPPNPEDKSIYIDPSSGLKYIFNGSVGGWETAIQPPVITNTDEEPSIELEGFLWWNHPDRMLYVYKGGDWIPIMRAGGSGYLGVPVVCDCVPPEYAREGWLWWDTRGGNLYVYYCDEPDYEVEGATGSCQWVVVVNGNDSGKGDALAIVSDEPPQVPQDGQMWYNNGTDVLYVWDAADPGQWKQAVPGYGGGDDGGAPSLITTQQPLRSQTNSSNVTNISIDQATTAKTGVVRFAKTGDEDANDVAVTPNFLKNNQDIVPDATDTRKGIVRLASDLQDTDGVVTAGVLKENASNEGFSNPVGTILMYASNSAPEGYLICNGDTLNIDASGNGMVQGVNGNFQKLYDLLGTSYSNNSEVRLPDMKGNLPKGYNTGNFGQYEAIQVDSGSQLTIGSISMVYCIKY